MQQYMIKPPFRKIYIKGRYIKHMQTLQTVDKYVNASTDKKEMHKVIEKLIDEGFPKIAARL